MLEHFSVLLLLLLPLILYHKGFRVPLSLLGITPDVYVVSPNSQVVRKGKGYTQKTEAYEEKGTETAIPSLLVFFACFSGNHWPEYGQEGRRQASPI